MRTLNVSNAKLCTTWRTPAHQATCAPTGETSQWYCWPSRFVVDLEHVGLEGAKPVTMHGAWLDRDGADAFARSADNGGSPRATVREVPEYWYAPAYGRVVPDDMTEPARELVTLGLGWLGGLIRATQAGYDVRELGYRPEEVERLVAHAATVDACEVARVAGAVAALRFAERAAFLARLERRP